MTKEKRDQFVLDNYESMSGQTLANETGWSLTTIKSVKRRYGLQKKSAKVLEMEEYARANYDGVTCTDKDIAKLFGMKHDNVRDALVHLGIYISEWDKVVARVDSLIHHSTYEKLSEYSNVHDTVELRCRECGDVRNVRVNNITEGFECRHEKHTLYLMTDGVHYKIGRSRNPIRRAERVNEDRKRKDPSAPSVELIAAYGGSFGEVMRAEKYWHQQFAHLRCFGESGADPLYPVFDGYTEFFDLDPQSLRRFILAPIENSENSLWRLYAGEEPTSI